MFGLPEYGGTCPGATMGAGGCIALKKEGGKVKTCYMDKLAKAYPALGESLKFNTEQLKNKSIDEMVVSLTEMMQLFINKGAGNIFYFRLHYSGDFFSVDYVKAWDIVLKRFPEIQFWVYTRSFDLFNEFDPIELLSKNDNITIFLSVDPINKDRGFKLYNDKYINTRNVGLAWMGNTQPEGHRWVTCPETSGKIKNGPTIGACAKCRLCVDNYKHKVKNIQFLIH